MRMNENNRQRIQWLDAAKGAAALLVVMGHITNGYLTAKHFLEWQGLIQNVHYLIYAFHMPLYMILSGYAFCCAYCVERPERRKRYQVQLLNIALLYFIFSLIKWISQTLLVKYVAVPVTMDDLLYVGISPLEELWYLYVLFFLYLIVYALEGWKISENIKLAMALLAGITGAAMDWKYRFPVDRILYYLFYFYLGVYLSRKPGGYIRKGRPLYAVGTVGAMIWIIRYGNIHRIPLLRIGAALSMSLLLLSFLMKDQNVLTQNNVLRRGLCKLGGYSLEIYVMHCYVIAAGRAFLPKVGIKSLFANVPIIFVCAVTLPIIGAQILKRLRIHVLFFSPAHLICREHKG